MTRAPYFLSRQRLKIAVMATCLGLSACTLPASGGSKIGGCIAGADLGESPAGLNLRTLCITSGAKTSTFSVEVAATSMEQAKGLMFRTDLADNAGMIFPFGEPRVASFWMKNTVIPLDIIFIRANGTIESIAENTVPYSTAAVAAGEPVVAVLELRGGLTSELGIGAGDKVIWEAK
ncbi:MAG: DUF192 domain-containing protein [Sphingorhabdus sp.]